jgi:hypothetical protein
MLCDARPLDRIKARLETHGRSFMRGTGSTAGQTTPNFFACSVQLCGSALVSEVTVRSAEAEPLAMASIMRAVRPRLERELMLERRREGIAKAKREGKYQGRKPPARAKACEVKILKAQGIGPSEIARRLGIGRTSVHHILTAA